MWFDIVELNRHFGFYDFSRRWRAITPVSGVLPEWRPVGIFLVNDGISLVEFQKGDESATWFVDESLTRIAGSIHELTEPQRRRISEDYGPAIERIYSDVFCYAASASDPTGFFNLNELTRREIAQDCFPKVARATIQSVLDEPCDLAHMLEALHKDFQEAIIAGARVNAIEFVDPSDGAPCYIKHGIAMDDFRAIYRIKTRNGRDLWACVSEHYASVVGIYDPSIDRFYVSSHEAESRLAGSFGFLGCELRQIVAVFGDVLPAYLNATETRVASFLRPPPANHLGHQLWNELSGIQFAVNRLVRHTLPRIVIPSADRGTEAFGPTEDIFPELRRSISRWPSELDFRRHAIISGLTLVRLSQRRISAELRARINVKVNCLAELEPEREKLSEVLRLRKKIVILGLRVENRTLDDLKSFVRNFLKACADVASDSIVVIDGHNSQRIDGAELILASHGQWGARRQPIEEERDLAAVALSEAQNLNVEVLSLIGESVDRSLFWSFHADCFVTVWGAGLAKYRWVANRPGYVITSAWNRLNRPDLHIYSDEQFMDTPEAIEFVPADEIVDLPDAEPLVSFQSDQQPESYYNFSLKDGHELAFLRNYLADLQRNTRT